jgi:hypothetical protein
VHRGLAEAVDAMVSIERTVDPDPTEKSRLDDGYGRFVDALAERGWLPGNPNLPITSDRIEG